MLWCTYTSFTAILNTESKNKTRQHNSISRFGSRLFDALPRYIRDCTGTTMDTFKAKLDKYLLTLPDEPNIPGYKMSIAASSNSIPDQIQYLNLLKMKGSNWGTVDMVMRLFMHLLGSCQLWCRYILWVDVCQVCFGVLGTHFPSPELLLSPKHLELPAL